MLLTITNCTRSKKSQPSPKPEEPVIVPSTDNSKLLSNMVLVPGGIFLMGYDVDAKDHPKEFPDLPHSVTVSDFYISDTEVTQDQWRDLMASNSDIYRPEFYDCDKCPIEGVSWNDAQMFIKALNTKTGEQYRLPTEAEWEHAARAGKNQPYKYSGSDEISEVSVFPPILNQQKPGPVRQKKANELGLFDMSGGVSEWCQDWYGRDYYKTSPSINPKGPDTGVERVIRGGSWRSNPNFASVAFREAGKPQTRYSHTGFRLAMSK